MRPHPLLLPLALTGLGVAVYLTLYQVGVLGSPWEPIFGDGSRKVLDLTSPVPDGAAGVVAYAIEVALLVARRGVLVLGLVLAGGVLTSVVLVIVQATVVGDWCTLCLVSAAISLTLGLLGRREILGVTRRRALAT